MNSDPCRQMLVRLIRIGEPLICDAKSVNESDSVHFDFEPERVIVDKANRALDAGNLGEYRRLSAELSPYAASVIPEAEARAMDLNKVAELRAELIKCITGAIIRDEPVTAEIQEAILQALWITAGNVFGAQNQIPVEVDPG